MLTFERPRTPYRRRFHRIYAEIKRRLHRSRSRGERRSPRRNPGCGLIGHPQLPTFWHLRGLLCKYRDTPSCACASDGYADRCKFRVAPISRSVDPESPSPPAAPLELGAGMAQTTSGDDLSAGAIAGIVIGVLVLLSCFVFILFFSFYRRKRCKAILENGMQCRDRAEKDGLCADHWQCSARMENGRRCSRCSEEKCERSMVGTYMFCKHHSHIAIKVEAVAAASRCVVFGRGLSQAIVKEVAEFSICAFDKNGVKRLTGGDEFKVSVKQMTQPPAILRARINDQDDGTYVCEYLPVVVGQVEITITHGGQALPGSPHIIEVISNSPPKPRYTVVKKAETSNINKIARICAKDAIEAAIEELRIEEQNFQRKPPSWQSSLGKGSIISRRGRP